MDDTDQKSLFVKLPKGYTGEIVSEGTVVHAVVISGELSYTMPETQDAKALDAGSYFGSTQKAIHTLANRSSEEVVVYVRTNGDMKIM